MEYQVDRDRAWEVLGKIWKRYSESGYPYLGHEKQLPQSHVPQHLPRGGALEAYYWLVLCIWMRGGNNSTTSAIGLAKLYDKLAEISCDNPFQPEIAALLDPAYLTQLIESTGLGMHESLPDWIRNAQILCLRYGGDVRDIFGAVSDYDQVCQRILLDPEHALAGFGYKMTSMLCYFLMEAELITPFPYPMPVDFHLQRVAIANQLIIRTDEPDDPIFARSDRDYRQIELLLRQLYLEFAIERDVPSGRFADALWVLSRTLCRLNPGNRTHQTGPYRARSTILTAHEPNWNNPRDRRDFERSCLQCPVRGTCTKNVRAGPRYRNGQLVTSERKEPHTLL